jgi:hypothetical protein
MSIPRIPLRAARLLAVCLFTTCYVFGQSQGGDGLHSRATVLGNDAPYSYPHKIVVGPGGDLYIPDTELFNIFHIEKKSGRVSRLCKPGALGALSDMAVDARGNIWQLDAYKLRVVKLNRRCEAQTNFAVGRTPMRVQVNSFGEVIVLTGEGEMLFDVYSADGKLLRSFGKRISYGDRLTDNELSDGHMVADASGGFYFSFNYPPLIQHYARSGRLLGEFKPETNFNLSPPSVTSQKQGSQLIVSSKYQIAVLDMAVDKQGRLYLLMSGQNKFQALTQGSRKLLVVSNKGKTLRKFDLQEDAFHRLAAGSDDLYLLRNRRALRLEMYGLP